MRDDSVAVNPYFLPVRLVFEKLRLVSLLYSM